jgi:2-methylaconitate cis-trans-isomerase PrpF
MSEQIRIKTVLMRGGSSKGVFIESADVPKDPAARERFVLALFGSPDKRQIDGLGGSDYLTSKCAIMGPPTRDDADIDYTMAQVSVEHPIVSFDTNCGNLSAACGLYAIEEGYVPAAGPETLVRVHNTNTGKILLIRVPIEAGAPKIEGGFAIDGVPGTGAEIRLDFSLTAGAATGQLLPTGAATAPIDLATLGRTIDVSVVDIANPCVFIRAADIGLTGAEAPADVPRQTLAVLEEIRARSAALSGIKSYLLPFQVIVGPPVDYKEYLSKRDVSASDVDLVARLFVEGIMHKAYAGTGATCLASAARIRGTVVNDVCRPRPDLAPIRIGHTSGVLPIVARVSEDGGGGWKVVEANFSRTARRIMEGHAFIRKSLLFVKSLDDAA